MNESPLSDHTGDLPTPPNMEALRVAASLLVERYKFARQAGLSFDDKRDMYGTLGYPQTITYKQYRGRYERGGIANKAVNALPSATWRGDGELIEDDKKVEQTTFEKEFDALNKRLKIWSVFGRADKLAQLGRYAVIMLGAMRGRLADELRIDKPNALLYLRIFGEDEAEVATYDEQNNSPRFGEPLTYKLKRSTIQTGLDSDVHWSRIIHIPSEGFLDDELFGPPTLQAIWNYLDDLDKVVGGGAEAFWLRANQGLHLDIDKDMSVDKAKDSIEDLKKQMEEYRHHMTRWLRTRGVSVETLGSEVADFQNPTDALMSLIAGTLGIPKRILMGSELGELASTQDRDNWHDQIMDRRSSYAEPMIVRPFIDRLIQYKYLSVPAQYETRWPTNLNLNDQERVDMAAKAATLNDHGHIVILPDEIRDRYLGMEPIDQTEVADLEAQAAEAAAAATPNTKVDQLTAALRKGGVVNLVVRGASEDKESHL